VLARLTKNPNNLTGQERGIKRFSQAYILLINPGTTVAFLPSALSPTLATTPGECCVIGILLKSTGILSVIGVLSHVDLRATARVRACREFLVDIIQQQRSLIEGLNSRYL